MAILRISLLQTMKYRQLTSSRSNAHADLYLSSLITHGSRHLVDEKCYYLIGHILVTDILIKIKCIWHSIMPTLVLQIQRRSECDIAVGEIFPHPLE